LTIVLPDSTLIIEKAPESGGIELLLVERAQRNKAEDFKK
jgi:hypothetical protein